MPFNFNRKVSTSGASVIIHTDKLLQFISVATQVVPKKTTMNALRNIRIHSANGTGYFRVTDSDCFVEMSLSNSGSGDIDLAVNFALFSSLIEKAPKGMLTIERKESSLVFNVNGFNCGTLPATPGIDCLSFMHPFSPRCFTLAVPKFDISYVQDYLVPWCINDKSYAGLHGILVETDETNYSFTATDRKTLVSTNLHIRATHRYAMPSKVFKILSSLDADVSMKLFSDSYSFQCNDIRIYGNYISGVYPDVHKLEPKLFEHTYDVNVGVLKLELNRMMSVVTPTIDGIYKVALTYGESALGISDVTDSFVFDKTGVKVDANRLLKMLSRFDDNSNVKFKSTCVLERPTVWEDSKGTSLLSNVR